ncbi:cyclophane-containing peptide 2OG-Fe(II) oxygenase YhhC [Spirosoma arcticum]
MHTAKVIDFSDTIIEQRPFPHFCAKQVFSPALEKDIYNWLSSTTIWELTRTEFYEQYEFSLLHITLPSNLRYLIEDGLVRAVKEQIEATFEVSGLELAGATVHKLTDGQRIGVHNDFIGKEESHRLLVQINANWIEDNGGYLLLFNSANAEDVSDIILPVSNSAFGFEISNRSNHAVSTVYNFSRYTLVYTFKQSEQP